VAHEKEGKTLSRFTARDRKEGKPLSLLSASREKEGKRRSLLLRSRERRERGFPSFPQSQRRMIGAAVNV